MNLVEQTGDKSSQLIEVIGQREVNILSNLNFVALSDAFNAKDYYRHALPYLGALANSTRAKNNFARQSGEANENQVGPCSVRAFDSVSFISGQGNAIAICYQQLLNAVAGLMNILHYQDDRRQVVFSDHWNAVLFAGRRLK